MQMTQTQTIMMGKEWTTWYPQEWIGWVMFGTLSENPTKHWVYQAPSNGPTDVEHSVDDKGPRSSKNPPGHHIMYIISI